MIVTQSEVAIVHTNVASSVHYHYLFKCSLPFQLLSLSSPVLRGIDLFIRTSRKEVFNA